MQERIPKLLALLCYDTLLHDPFHVIRGGFSLVPYAVFIGLLVPILSMFMSDRSTEPGCWLGVFLLCISAIRFVEMKELLPTPQINAQMIAQANCTNCVLLSSIYLLLIWFVIHVYAVEMERRHILQKDLNLFMRLSHEIRTPITVLQWTAPISCVAARY